MDPHDRPQHRAELLISGAKRPRTKDVLPLVAQRWRKGLQLPTFASPEEMLGLLVELGLSRKAYQRLINFANLQSPGEKMFPSGDKVDAAWTEMAKAQVLDVSRDSTTGAVAVSWPWLEWLCYMATQPFPIPDLEEGWNDGETLVFIVRGDAYPVAGSSWTQLNVSLRNFGRQAPTTPHTFVRGAYQDDTDLQLIGKLCKK